MLILMVLIKMQTMRCYSIIMMKIAVIIVMMITMHDDDDVLLIPLHLVIIFWQSSNLKRHPWFDNIFFDFFFLFRNIH